MKSLRLVSKTKNEKIFESINYRQAKAKNFKISLKKLTQSEKKRTINDIKVNDRALFYCAWAEEGPSGHILGPKE